jgi:antitoxin component of MazEF toxin-antitoxin module
LAVRIPQEFAGPLELKTGSDVRITCADGVIVITRQKEIELSSLLAQITPESLPSETDWGSPRGRETW